MASWVVKTGAVLARFSGILALVEAAEAKRSNILRILVYHRIGSPQQEQGQLDPSLLSASPEQFEQQMRFLSENYHLVSIRELLKAIDNGLALPPRSVMVTFDDGYRCFLDVAWPIMEKYHVPALMFLATAFCEPGVRLFWWDELYQAITRTNQTELYLGDGVSLPLYTTQQRWSAFNWLKHHIKSMVPAAADPFLEQTLAALQVIPETDHFLLDWEQVRWLDEHGCYLASHTRNHSILSRLGVDRVIQEVSDARRDLGQQLDTVWPVFAYPSGHIQDVCPDLTPAMSNAGLRLAMSSCPGYNDLRNCNYQRLKRIGLSPSVTLPEFRLLLTGIYNSYCEFQDRIFHNS